MKNKNKQTGLVLSSLENDFKISEYVSRIKQLHEKTVSLNDDSKEKGKLAVQSAIDCGNQLIALRESKLIRGYEKWFKANIKTMSPETAYRYMRLANRADMVKDCTSIRQAYLVTLIITMKASEPVDDIITVEKNNIPIVHAVEKDATNIPIVHAPVKNNPSPLFEKDLPVSQIQMGEPENKSDENILQIHKHLEKVVAFFCGCNQASNAKHLEMLKPLVTFYNETKERLEKQEQLLNDGFDKAA